MKISAIFATLVTISNVSTFALCTSYTTVSHPIDITGMLEAVKTEAEAGATFNSTFACTSSVELFFETSDLGNCRKVVINQLPYGAAYVLPSGDYTSVKTTESTCVAMTNLTSSIARQAYLTNSKLRVERSSASVGPDLTLTK